jgi:hypothetical protein
MKTILQALRDEIHFPVGTGHLENRLLRRGLIPNEECSLETFNDARFIGAVADSLWFLISAPNISESDKSVNGLDKNAIAKQANQLYKSIGEEQREFDKPMVSIEN